MKKTLFTVLLAATMVPFALAAPKKSSSKMREADSYAEAQKKTVPENGYVVALYADGWDKFSKKLVDSLLKDSAMKKSLADSVVIRYGAPNFASEAGNKARADKLGNLKWTGAYTYPAFVLYDKNGRQYATVLVPYSDRENPDKIAEQIKSARESLAQQNELLEKAKSLQGVERAEALGQSAVFENINRPDNIVKMIKEADPQDKSGYVRRLEFNMHGYAESTAKTDDWRKTLQEVEDKIADKAYSDAQRQGLYCTAIGLLRRHGSTADNKKMKSYLSKMKQLDPNSIQGASADHAELLWVSNLSVADGWTPSVLPLDTKPAEIAGPLPINEAGTYEVAFHYTRGQHQLNIKGVQLYDGDKKIAEDIHVGSTGIRQNQNIYTLVVPKKLANPRLMGSFDMEKNRDSYGNITITKKK